MYVCLFLGEGLETVGCQKEKKLPPPNPAVGDRKRLLADLKAIPQQFVKPVKDLLEKLDNLLIESPSEVARMERLQFEVEEVLDAVRSHAKENDGDQYITEVIDVIGAPKDSSSIVTYEKIIGNKILPFLRSHLQDKKPGFKVTDLLAFGKENFTRVHEEMVIDCNANVGKTSAVKKVVLVCWTVLLRAIAGASLRSVDEIGDEAVRWLERWYEQLAKRVGHGVTKMKSLYERSRTEKSQSRYSKDQMPMDKVLKKWIHSEERLRLQTELRETANAIESGRGGVQTTARSYSALSEFVQTELSVYGPVRIGAVGRMTVRMFLQSMPAWSSSEYGFDPARPVTLPPPDACQHQRNPKANEAAKCGLRDTGERCCDQSIPPTCFLMANEKDKGGKSNSYIAMTRETHGLVSSFLTVRNDFFEKNKPQGEKHLQGNCSIFLSAKGKDPRETSDFKLAILNKAVFGENSTMHVTPQQLRKWNTTFLKNHPDAKVAAMRGEATGNTDAVFNQYYNLARQSGVLEALLATFRRHLDEEASVQWSQEHDERRKNDKLAMEEANLAMLYKEDGTDLTSRSKPVHRHLRHQFKEELERVEPGLWRRAGGVPKSMTLSEGKWIKGVLAVLGRAEAEHLRDIIFQQYRGLEDPQRRQWSSLRSHLVGRQHFESGLISCCFRKSFIKRSRREGKSHETVHWSQP